MMQRVLGFPPLLDNNIHLGPLRLHVIADEMLHCRSHTLFLDAIDQI